MPLDNRDASRVLDMLRNGRIAARLVKDRSQEDLASDDLLRLALERAIEIIGEAARKVSPDAQVNHPEIPWRKIVQQRHIIAHDYADLNYHAIWRVATVHIPALIPQLEAILPEPPPDPLPEDPETTP